MAMTHEKGRGIGDQHTDKSNDGYVDDDADDSTVLRTDSLIIGSLGL